MWFMVLGFKGFSLNQDGEMERWFDRGVVIGGFGVVDEGFEFHVRVCFGN